ncbi:hypothetical protein BGW80DRAFT_1446609, partial [Lactifluus volemus]
MRWIGPRGALRAIMRVSVRSPMVNVVGMGCGYSTLYVHPKNEQGAWLWRLENALEFLGIGIRNNRKAELGHRSLYNKKQAITASIDDKIFANRVLVLVYGSVIYGFIVKRRYTECRIINTRRDEAELELSDIFDGMMGSILQDAIKQYEKDIGTSLIENQFAVRLRSCDTIESITEALEEQAHDLSGFVMITSIRRMARVLCTVFLGPGTPLGGLGGLGAIQVGHDIGSVYLQPVKLVFSALGILLVTVKDVDASYDVLLKLFESLGNFIQRFDIHTETLPTMVISRLIVKIIVELLSTLAQVTKYLLKVSEEDEVEATLKKLDIFTQDEARAIGANTEKRQLFANVVTGDRMRQDLQRWLSPPDPSINHNIACDACHDRTATWFIQGDTFTEWKSSGSLLWVCGKPGAGKTILCSTIIENINSMLKSGLASLAFFYCDFRAEEKKDRRGLLSSLVFQLGDQSDSYSRILSDLYSEHGYGSQGPSDASLEQCLKDILRSPGEPPIYVIVDALDECPGAYGTPSPRGRVLMLME